MEKTKTKKKRKTPVKPLLDPLDLEQIIEDWKKIRSISWKRAALFSLTYFTGARISEIKQLRKKDIVTSKKNGKELMVVKLLTLKNPRHKTRLIPIVKNDKYAEMFDDLKNWLSYFRDYELLFPYTRQWLNELFKRPKGNTLQERITRRAKAREIPLIKTKGYYYNTKEVKEIIRPYYPHFLRHCRLSHLATYHHFNTTQLMYWAGWSDPKLANIYIRMDWWALAKQIQEMDEW